MDESTPESHDSQIEPSSKKSEVNPEAVVSEIDSRDPDIFKDIPHERKVKIVKAIREDYLEFSMLAKQHVGPLPSPETLEEYNKVIPDFAERLLENFEKQSTHRMDFEKQAVRRGFNQSGTGQIFAFILALLIIGAGVAIILSGYEIPGTIVIGIDIIALLIAFIKAQSRQKKELNNSD